MADRLAAEGFVVIAPDMFGGVVVDTVEAAEQEAGRHDKGFAETFAVVRRAERVVRDRGEIGRGIGVMGFSFGAAYALELVADPPPDEAIDAVCSPTERGPSTTGRIPTPRSRAISRPTIPSSRGRSRRPESALRSAGRPVEFHRYPGVGHWFMEPDREDAYNGDAADLAFGRIVAFLRENLGSLGHDRQPFVLALAYSWLSIWARWSRPLKST